ncbi:MAG: hypothetical protein AAF297_12155 [Planctomycetota bacterium]
MFIAGCSATEHAADASRFPAVTVTDVFAPPGESNVRSSFALGDGAALIGTEETGDVYKTTDSGRSWVKMIDGGDDFGIQDVRNFLRGQDGLLYATTSEPALVLRSDDEGESWAKLVEAPASRTVALEQLADGTMIVGLRRSENDRISVLRSGDGFESFEVVVLDDDLPRQNTTCVFETSTGAVLAGVGFELSGKVFRSADAGRTWTQTAEFAEARDLMDFFEIDGRLFVTASGIATIYVSDDDGRSWSRHAQIWDKGFLGEHAELEFGGQTYHLLSGTDQRADIKRHVVLISADAGETWREWIELTTDVSGGASNLEVIDGRTVIVGTGNHAVQGRVWTLTVR